LFCWLLWITIYETGMIYFRHAAFLTFIFNISTFHYAAKYLNGSIKKPEAQWLPAFYTAFSI